MKTLNLDIQEPKALGGASCLGRRWAHFRGDKKDCPFSCATYFETGTVKDAARKTGDLIPYLVRCAFLTTLAGTILFSSIRVAAASEHPPRFVLKWGAPGAGDGEFQQPRGVAVDGAGNVYIADLLNSRIQKFYPDGTFITTLVSGGQLQRPHGLAVDSPGNVYVTDLDMGMPSYMRALKYDPYGNLLGGWGGFNFPYGVTVDNAGNVYIADTYHYRIQKIRVDGTSTTWGSVGCGNGMFQSPRGVAVDRSGSFVYVADAANIHKFTSEGTFLARWGTGNCWPGSGDGEFNYPWGVAVDSAGNVYVADTENDRIQKFSPDGTFLTKWGSTGTGDGELYRPYGVAADNSGNIYVADTYNNRIQKFVLPGAVDLPFYPNPNSQILCTAVQADGKILIGGGFNAVGGTTRIGFARLNADGTLDTGFNVNLSLYGVVRCAAVQANGKIVFGGGFTSVGGAGRSRIARVHPDGTVDTTFNPNANGSVECVMVQADGKIVIGGGLTAVGTTSCNNIVRLNPDGTLDTGFSPGLNANANSVVLGTALQADGKIVISGRFTAVGDTSPNTRHVVRLNPDGTLDLGFNPDVNGDVYCSAVQPDGKIVIGGYFSTVGGATRNNIARFNADGTLDPGFNPDASSYLSSMALQADGKIVIGGYFATVGGTARTQIARLNADGTLDLAFNPSANELVRSTELQADGKIVIAGIFTSVGGTPRNRIARLLNDAATQTLTVPSAARAEWLRGGTAPETTLVTFDLSTDGTTWTTLGPGTRITGGWELTGLSLPPSGMIRARARTTAGEFNGSSGLVESVQSFLFNSTPVAKSKNVTVPADEKCTADACIDDGSFDPDPGDTISLTQSPPGPYPLGDTPVTLTVTDSHGASSQCSAIVTVVDTTPPSVSCPTGTSVAADANCQASVPDITALITASDNCDASLALSQSPAAGMLVGLGTHTILVAATDDAGNTATCTTTFTVVAEPEIAVEQPAGTDLVDGTASLDFGNVLVGASSAAKTFTVVNRGTADLTGLAITTDGSHPGDFTVGAPGATTLAPGASTSFTVTFTPAALGARSATLHLASNDHDENPFDITLTGRGAAEGAVDSGFDPNVDYRVLCTTPQPDGKVVIGGYFTTVGGTPRYCIARLNAEGGLDIGFNPNANGSVSVAAVQADGKTVIGGIFLSLAGVTRGCIARINADGTLDAGFDPGANGYIWSMAVEAGGKILIGGQFTTVGGAPRNFIARINSDGSLDAGFNPNPNARILSMAIQEDGKILIGGDFNTVGGTARNHIARLNVDGTLDTDFNPSANEPVYNIALQADGRIIVGGWFTSMNGLSHAFLARLNQDGTLDTGFIHPDLDSLPYSTTVQADGKVLLSGYFTSIGGTIRNKIARLHADGSLDTDFDPAPNEWVWSTMLQYDGRILIAGGFTAVGGVPRHTIARLLNGEATQSLSVPHCARVQWLRGGTAPETTQVSFELTTDGLNWVPLGAGTRIAGGWELTGLSLPEAGTIRARARTTGSHLNGSSGLVESVGSFYIINSPPVAKCKDVTVPADESCTANASIDDGSFDLDPGDTITLSQSPPGPYPMGQTLVTLTVTDNHGASSSGPATVTVVDTTPPTLVVPGDMVVVAPDTSGVVVNYVVSATDWVDPSVAISCVPPSGTVFPVGSTTVRCMATDDSGNIASATFHVIVTLNEERATGGWITPAGGTSITPDESVEIGIPQGALSKPTFLSVAEVGSNYVLMGVFGHFGLAVYGVNIQPDGTQFGQPATIVMRWPDEDNDGRVDGMRIWERYLMVVKDGVPVTPMGKDYPEGFDPVANTITFQVSSLSVFALVFFDVEGPVSTALEAVPNPVPVGSNIVLHATVDDTATGDTPIYVAACAVDSLAEEAFVAMSAVDGAYDDVIEAVVANLPAFAQPGVHTVYVRAWDEMMNEPGPPESLFLPVFDPDGGFVTGGGWIDSPLGAYTTDPTLTGKATFGFVAKYRKGATVPTGNTEFQFKAGNLNFKSTSYQWLVVAGARAQFKGWGSINGQGNYAFMLTAIDGQVSGGGGLDRFRIKIWDEASGTKVYDNQHGTADNAALGDATVLQGGSIVIHKP